MSNIDLKRLFIPGDGGIPPYLAGRDREQEYFRDCVDDLMNQRPIGQNMIIYGPRGNGKTALLRSLQKETIVEEKTSLDIVWLKPYQLETGAGLENLIIGDTGKSKGPVKNIKLSASVGVVGASVGLDYSKPAATLENLLRSWSQASKVKPLILMIDEAHTLKPEIGQVLLNVSQDLRSEGHPFLLILAGTPNLKSALGKTNASFWERSEKIRLGRLSPDEASQAITTPLEQAGISFATGVVDEIVGRAHGYPFFLQVWGDCLARRLAQTGQTEITLDTVKEASAAVTNKRDDMYQDRFNEIIKMELLAVATSVADAFMQSGKPHLHGSVLMEAVAKGMAGQDEPVTDGRVMENLEQLSHLGYVWQVNYSGMNSYEPGIPSLMTYIHRNSLEQQPKAESSPLEKQIRKFKENQAMAQDDGIEM